MTLIKSVLLGSAATLVVVAGAQAADLPTKKGAPAAEYVKVCKVGGIAGFIIPGSDTCLKISGGVFAMASGGNLNNGYDAYGAGVALAATKYRDDVGLYGRADLGLEAVSNTAYGPLVSVIDIHWDQGYGMNQAGPNGSYINNAYIQWAGLTAGITSFYDYIGGGNTWNNIFSPDHNGDRRRPVRLHRDLRRRLRGDDRHPEPQNADGFSSISMGAIQAFGPH